MEATNNSKQLAGQAVQNKMEKAKKSSGSRNVSRAQSFKVAVLELPGSKPKAKPNHRRMSVQSPVMTSKKGFFIESEESVKQTNLHTLSEKSSSSSSSSSTQGRSGQKARKKKKKSSKSDKASHDELLKLRQSQQEAVTTYTKSVNIKQAEEITRLVEELEEEKKQKKLFESIKLLPDEQLDEWQRQIKVNKFMLDLSVKQTIEDLIKPVVNVQLELRKRLEIELCSKLEHTNGRLQLLEQTVYGKKGPENRFIVIEKELRDLRKASKENFQHNNGQLTVMQEQLDHTSFDLTARVKSVENMGSDIEGLKTRYTEQQERIDSQIELLRTHQVQFKLEIRNANWKLSDKVGYNMEKLSRLQDQFAAITELQTSMHQVLQEQGDKLIAFDNQIFFMDEKKVDKTTFEESQAVTDQNYLSLRQRVDNMQHDLNMTGNYLQKFVPMEIQRAITHVVSFVWPKGDIAWRMNWYNEVRMPMLSAALLTDEGRSNLNKKMQSLIKFVTANPTDIMEINGEYGEITNKKALMQDEQLMTKVLGNKKLHAMSKIVIFQKLDEIEHERQKRGISLDTARDMHETEVDFGELQDQLVRLIIQEDPEEAKKMGILPSQVLQAEKDGESKGKEEDEEDEQGLEAQVLNLVERYVARYQDQQNARIADVEESVSCRMAGQTVKLEEMFQAKAGAMEREINMVAMQHIHDFEAIKNVTKEFVLSKDRLQQKVQIVVDMERQYQILLQQMRKTSSIVDQLVDMNLGGSLGNLLANESSTQPTQQMQSLLFTDPADPMVQSSKIEFAALTPEIIEKTVYVPSSPSDQQQQQQQLKQQSVDFNEGNSDLNDTLGRLSQKFSFLRPDANTPLLSDVEEDKTSQINRRQTEVTSLESYFKFVGNNQAGVNDNQSTLSNVTKSISAKNQLHMQTRRTIKVPQSLENRNCMSPVMMSTSYVSQEADGGLTSAKKEEQMDLQVSGLAAVSSEISTSEMIQEARPKSQAATGTAARIRRNANNIRKANAKRVQNQSAAQFMRQASGNSIQVCRPSQFSMPDQAVSSSRLQNVSSALTSNIKAFNVSKQSTRLNAGPALSRRELTPQVVPSAEFDRKKAIQKLSKLGTDARHLMTKLDSMILENESQNLKDGKKQLQKQWREKKQGMNTMPNSEQFRQELLQFQARLNNPSKADKIINRSGGVLHSLNFSVQGVDMRLGIGHNSTEQPEVKLKKRNRGRSLLHDTTQDIELPLTQLASRQQFETSGCIIRGMTSPNNAQEAARQLEEIKATESSASQSNSLDRPQPSVRRRGGHIFCKNEIVQSVKRVL